MDRPVYFLFLARGTRALPAIGYVVGAVLGDPTRVFAGHGGVCVSWLQQPVTHADAW